MWHDRRVASSAHRTELPRFLAPLFPEVSLRKIDAERDARFVLARVLESGRMDDVAWCMRRYGLGRIRTFFREEGDPSLSRKTIALWRLVLDERTEPWATSRRSRVRNIVPWPG